jgi:hypothetical protein
MAIAHLVRHLLAMPPREAASKVLRHAKRIIGYRLLGRLMRNQCSYPPLTQVTGRLGRRFGPLDRAVLAGNTAELRALAENAVKHRFNLLGSGPVEVAYGQHYSGFGRYRYGPGPKPVAGQDWRDWLAARHWGGNRGRARLLLDLIEDTGYRPIDWQADFISGYRWSERTLGRSVSYGHLPGVDIKVPWELARLQHLPGLALAYGLSGVPRLVAEFRHQVLDFLGANPPGWGVNWACAMDVAIRAVNILVARDLFLAHGAAFDDDFEQELVAGILAHARHLAGNLEWDQDHRGNHYLADICGLAWVAAYLPRCEETDLYLVFATQQLAVEIERQFGGDGANFEASTAYHRLSAEMALYTVAMLLGLPPERRAIFADFHHHLWRRTPAINPGPMAWPPFSSAVLARLARAARFAVDICKPSGEMVQVGDNDSGRFLVLAPGDGPLDCRHIAAAAQGLFALELVPPTIETAIVAALAGGLQMSFDCEPAHALTGTKIDGSATRATRVTIHSDALVDLQALAYPEFGLFIWRNARAFVAVRCGPVGQNGNGGHAHNDQLAVELEIDGIAWARDPGTFVYTPDLVARNAYRSVRAHFAPRCGDAEPARMLAPFKLEDRAQARVYRFDGQEFAGSHVGFGEPVWRRVSVGGGRLVIEDCWGGPVIAAGTIVTEHVPPDPAALAEVWGETLPFSGGYGRR